GGSIEELAASVVFPREGVALHAWLPLAELGGAESGNDCWGYTSPSGRRYALVGTSSGTAFVEVTVPGDPQVVAVHAGPTSLWRDVKTYQHHAYAVSEGGSGIQVFDLGQIDAGVVALVNTVTSGPSTSASHNVAIDEVSGFLYRCGGGDNGLRIYSLANPANPTYVGQWTTRYVHDVQVVTYTSGPLAGRQIAYACSGFNGGFVETGVDALDVTSKTNIVALDRVTWPGAEYSHQAWLSEDRRYLYVNDELDEGSTTATTRTYVIDALDPSNLAYLGSFTNGSPAVGHNLYVHDGLVLEANYTSGLRVFDANVDPLSPPEVAWFDTEPLTGAASFNSLWSNYPFFGDGLVIGSDLEKGLFVWHVGPPEVAFEFPTGVPTVAEPGGTSFAVRIVEATPGALDAA
ncbi:MAG TPA: choice-of-anchor B family protein, partial [Planctomycetota bacterium]|nr:choice-of-anchor B family protein [Planctomycetota bacterium]